MNFLLTLDVSASGLNVQKKRMEIIAENLANIDTTRTEKGIPYRRKMLIVGTKDIGKDFHELLNIKLNGAQVEDIIEDMSPFKRIYNPGHPDADKDGYVYKPNIDLIVETTNMLMARRSYEANISAIKVTRQMILKALEIGR